MDTGASEHMCWDKRLFETLTESQMERKVKIGDGNMLDVAGIGNVILWASNGQQYIKTIPSKVVYVPNLKFNLFSVGCALDEGYSMTSDSEKCELLDENGRVRAIAKRNNKSYKMDFVKLEKEIHSRITQSCFVEYTKHEVKNSTDDDIGYSEEVKGYRVFFPDENEVECHRDIIFLPERNHKPIENNGSNLIYNDTSEGASLQGNESSHESLVEDQVSSDADVESQHEEAMHTNEETQWKEAIEAEISALQENDTWVCGEDETGENKVIELMSEEDRQLIINNVQIIFHSAASVRFDDSLRYSIILNVRGTREVIDLASEVKNLSVFVHISTTYCNIDKKVVEEKIYPPHADWRSTIELAEKYDNDILNAMATKYISPLPNTYTFAKSLSEHVVNDMCREKISAVIIRPSIVTASMEEPFPGWIDNTNGPIGLLAAGAKGVLRTVLGNPETVQDMMCVDHVAKIIILGTHHKATKRDCDDVDIYNCSNGDYTPLKLGELLEMGEDLVQVSPLSQMLWYPNYSMTRCWYNFYIQVILFHMIPAYFLDISLRIIGKKPMLFAIQRKIYIANAVLAHFMKNTWKFVNQKYIQLYNQLSEEDKSVFGVAAKHLVLNKEELFQFFKNGKNGVALYVLKEGSDSTEEKSLKTLWRLWLLDRIVKSIAFVLATWLFIVKWNILGLFFRWLEDYISKI
ncbi:hypothetical protein JTB14_007026 [Gonioctena quinquepunctata]|nr:hypothetical protein JTB14_007026 [Gonioctena quinquepunctata]